MAAILEHESSRDGLPAVQLLESTEYCYEWEFFSESTPEKLTTTRDRELFFADDPKGLRGRLRPHLSTGTIEVELRGDGHILGRLAFEVRSKKLTYESDYRSMLTDITDVFAEAVLHRFASAAHRFVINPVETTESLYPRFAFLQSVLDGGRLESALHHIISRPYVQWKSIQESQSPDRGVRGSSALARQVARPGPRQKWRGGTAAVPSLPTTVEVRRSFADVDNYPNRFVRSVLDHWRAVVAELGEQLQQEKPTTTTRRGVAEVGRLLQKIDGFLADPMFRSVGRLDHIVPGNQVLQKRSGYRTVLSAFLQSDLAASLIWEGGTDVFGAGKRDVATLYEYWVYLTMAKLLSDLCNERPLDLSELLHETSTGPSIGLKRGRTSGLTGRLNRGGVTVELTVFFNRSFTQQNGGVWSRNMRPDVSVLFHVERHYDIELPDVWLHFDAKYRVDNLTSLFGSRTDAADEMESISGRVKRDDLIKMHAYRDAIHRSLGAYVLYPGSEDQALREYQELLPGLGAFALSPSETGLRGEGAVRRFLSEVVDHLVGEATQDERRRYWSNRIEAAAGDMGAPVYTRAAESWLPRPPADTWVTLGYVKSGAQLEWIHQQQKYNVRGLGSRAGGVPVSSRVLASDLLLLYCPAEKSVTLWSITDGVQSMSRAELQNTGYPEPGGEQYFVLNIEPVLEDPPALPGVDTLQELARIGRDRTEWGGPIAMTWSAFLSEL